MSTRSSGNERKPSSKRPPPSTAVSAAAETTAKRSRRVPTDTTKLSSTSAAANSPSSSTPADDSLLSYEWMGDSVSVENGKKYYESIRFSSNRTTYSLNKGDAVYLPAENNVKLVCRLNRFFVSVDNDSSASGTERYPPVKVEGAWFLKRSDLLERLGHAITAADSQEFMKRLETNELVMTSLVEENDIAAIQGTCNIAYIKLGQAQPTTLSSDNFFCRYKLEIDIVRKTLEWGTLDTEMFLESTNRPHPTEAETQTPGKKKNAKGAVVLASDDDTSSTSGSSVDGVSKSTIQRGEGATRRGDIQVGSRFQMKVGPYVPFVKVASRGPKLVYQANRLSDDETFAFLNSVALLHNSYLNRSGLSMDEPYTPLSQDRAEEIMRSIPGNKPLTGSFMSTASMIAGKRSRLAKECCADALLEILADHEYNTARALTTIQANLSRITVGWSRPEKEIFDDGFRRHQGALRLIVKAIGPTKSIKDVVDYYYRFKIPDQFRKYQDKKREYAVRMVECIETKRYHDFSTLSQGAVSGPINGCQESSDIVSHWSGMPVSTIADAKEERIRAAKKLLLDVKEVYGRDTMAEVAAVVRQLQRRYEPEARDDLFNLLTTQPDLQIRFLEFLPKQF